MNTTAVGRAAEDFVAACLTKKGCQIISRNARTRFYEIDLVTLKDNQLHFVEVRYRRDHFAGGGLDSIDRAKLSRLTRAIETWTSENPAYQDCEISLDIASVSGQAGKFTLSYLTNITS